MDDNLEIVIAILAQAQLLDKDLARHYQHAAKAVSCRFLTYLATTAHICPKAIAQNLASHCGLSVIDLDSLDKTCLPLHAINKTLWRQRHIIPIMQQHNQLYIAVDDPTQQAYFKDLQFQTGLTIIPMVASTLALTHMIETLLRETDHQALTHYLSASPSPPMPTPSNSNDEAPIVSFVQRMLQQAVARNATDLHFEPYDNSYRIRCRQDGMLHELATPPYAIASRVAARLKIMADLDITERRLPQDGRFSFSYTPQHSIDCRFSSCPTVYGEKIVIRLLNNNIVKLDIEHLGLSIRDKDCLIQALQRPQGLILVTGPTGSGKTTTMYAALHQLNIQERNISSVEDPVEIKQFGINQLQVNPKIGLNFTTALRALLRQDPDVIMIGEIRDYETAEIAIKASLTGHLVISTLHTNSSAETIMRLQQLGIPSFLLASSLTLVVAQRLIRQLCPQCKVAYTSSTHTYLRAQGCPLCYRGYRGRKAIFEVMPISEQLQYLIMSPHLTAQKLAIQAQREGMENLYQAGLNYVQQGVTSVEEINRII